MKGSGEEKDYRKEVAYERVRGGGGLGKRVA